MPAIWTGVIAFGLVSIPVSLRSATTNHDVSMHQYHAADGGRIRYQKVCELDDEVVPPEDIVKGVDHESGEVVLLDEGELEDLPVSSSKTIEVVQFVSSDQIDPIHYERSYYADPGKAAGKPYVLLREALEESGKIAIVKVALRRRESLAALRPRDDALVLHTMLWPDEIRAPEVGGIEKSDARKQELQMAATLIDAMTGDFDPEDYSDEYQEALRALIDAKARGGRRPAKSKAETPKAKVISLMDALQKSVEAKEGSRRPAKKTAKKAAKKSTARKTAAKKTAKQAAARKRKSA